MTSRAVAAVLALTATLTACGTPSGRAQRPARTARPPAAAAPSATPAAPSTTPPPGPTAPPPARTRRADAAVTRLTRSLGHGGVSVAALDTDDDTGYAFGARHGMLCASTAKLAVLETLLLQHQRGASLGAGTRALAAAMIEHSDNDAANALYVRIGEGTGLRRAAPSLGLHHTTPGSGIYWGYTRTGAPAYLALLRDLDGPGPLGTASRHYALHLLRHVEADQRWGVGSVADPGTSAALKNGWLPVSTDDGRWAVDTVGLVTVHGQHLLLAVFTQHGSSFDGGVRLVDRLARIAATAVSPPTR